MSERTRRELLRDAGVVAAGTAALSVPGASTALARRRKRRQTVAIFGGGIAGLSAAHELIERGFDVTVYERRAWGGKARSTILPGTAQGGRRPLPGEHSHRVEFGWYQNLPDTLKRIPFGSNPNGVFDNLVGVPQLSFHRVEKHDLFLPLLSLDPRPYTPTQVLDTILGVALDLQLPPDAAAHFVNRMAVFLSSCDARRRDDWEKTTWFDFIGAADYDEDYRKILGELPQFIQASRKEKTCARYIALVFELVVYNLLGFGSNGPVYRIFDRPTNDAWIRPWTKELRRLGCSLRLGEEIVRLDAHRGRISAAEVRSKNGKRRVEADWFVCALPVERARRLWNNEILKADPQLREMRRLDTAWMNGIQFYLDRPSEILEGQVTCIDSPWALVFVPQAQFWKHPFAETYGDGRVQDKLSVLIGDFEVPGIKIRKRAERCTSREIATEVWHQIKLHVNNAGRPALLTDEMLLTYELDPGLVRRHGRLTSEDPLVLPEPNTLQFRPATQTGLRNLVLSGDYLDTPWEVANMEAPSYAGRRAANAILQAADSNEDPAATLEPYRPPEWEPSKKIDEDRYRRGLPNMLDVG